MTHDFLNGVFGDELAARAFFCLLCASTASINMTPQRYERTFVADACGTAISSAISHLSLSVFRFLAFTDLHMDGRAAKMTRAQTTSTLPTMLPLANAHFHCRRAMTPPLLHRACLYLNALQT